MPTRYAVANWKMNLPPEGIEEYLDALERGEGGAELVVAPPFPYVARVAGRVRRAKVAGQNCAEHVSGAYTGEVSATMLRGCGARFVIIGHSERRTLHHESDAGIARKLALAITAGLTPILCVGEDLRVRDAGRVGPFLGNQIKAAMTDALEHGSEIIIAYEPVWAIGTGRNATSAMVAEAIGEIREALGRFWPAPYEKEAPILYGGSVTPENVDDLAANGRIEGFLVGGASLDSGKFLAIHAAMK